MSVSIRHWTHRTKRQPASHSVHSRVLHWRWSSRASSARLRCCGSHPRNACDRHRWGQCARSGLGGWRPPPELSIVALCHLAAYRNGARALSFRAVPHWRWSSCASSARPRCCGSQARSARDLYRCGLSAWSGLRRWRPPPELGAVALKRLASRRTGARALSCHVVLNWRRSSRASSALPRCCGSHARSARDLHRCDHSA